MLLPPDLGVMVEHIVEIGEVRKSDPVLLLRRYDSLGALRVEGLSQVERICHRVEHGLGRHIGLRGVERGRQLNVVGIHLPRERHPLLDGAVGVVVADFARGQLLQSCRQDTDLHELRLERSCHGIPPGLCWRTKLTFGRRCVKARLCDRLATDERT